MRKIGSITPLWNQELFIKPHFNMLKDLDRNLVLVHDRPLPSYKNEHGYSTRKDLSEQILREQFPHVELVDALYPPELDFMAGLYNEGLRLMQDCDIVLRLDPDMLWNEKDWKAFVNLLRTTNNDCYRMDFANDSINYYMTGDFDHGLKDAQETDPLAVDPHRMFTGVLDYRGTNEAIIKLPGWMCHHFRGWNKPKSTPATWHQTVEEVYVKKFGNDGGWFKCDPEVRKNMEEWLQELNKMKQTVDKPKVSVIRS